MIYLKLSFFNIEKPTIITFLLPLPIKYICTFRRKKMVVFAIRKCETVLRMANFIVRHLREISLKGTWTCLFSHAETDLLR